MFSLILDHPRLFSAMVVAFTLVTVGLIAYFDLKD